MSTVLASTSCWPAPEKIREHHAGQSGQHAGQQAQDSKSTWKCYFQVGCIYVSLVRRKKFPPFYLSRANFHFGYHSKLLFLWVLSTFSKITCKKIGNWINSWPLMALAPENFAGQHAGQTHQVLLVSSVLMSRTWAIREQAAHQQWAWANFVNLASMLASIFVSAEPWIISSPINCGPASSVRVTFFFLQVWARDV